MQSHEDKTTFLYSSILKTTPAEWEEHVPDNLSLHGPYNTLLEFLFLSILG